ncbi:MAG TPA: TlpA disulfide reductase family protein [Streptosporangiaceae bacterium]|nr:TlpA disulfide reductase family protein [Streptosporangiaceae bacterium]
MSGRIARRRTPLVAGVVAAVAVIVALLASGLGRDPSVIASPLVGRMAPNFTLPQLNGPPVTLSTLRGQIVVINFWASWCTECKVEQAALVRTWQQFQDSGVVVLGVDFEDETNAARSYVSSADMTYPVVEDANSNTALAYGLRGVPETFVVNQTGRIVDHVIGPVDEATLTSQINSMLLAGVP